MKGRLYYCYLGVIAVLCLCSISFAQKQDHPDGTKNRPLKILSKPRPGIPVETVHLRIRATVLVLVEFQANGKIGEVECVNEAGSEIDNLKKYGLVRETIRAAKGIRFNPEIKDWQPLTVKKRLEYSFSIN